MMSSPVFPPPPPTPRDYRAPIAGYAPPEDETMPSTPYTPRDPYATPGSPRVVAKEYRGDAAGEHLWMKRGRFSAWPHVVLAFLFQAALFGALSAAPAWWVVSTYVSEGAGTMTFASLALATGPLIGFFTFRGRWKVIEAFSSRFCVGLLNLSLLYVPLVAFAYANVRVVQKLMGRG